MRIEGYYRFADGREVLDYVKDYDGVVTWSDEITDGQRREMAGKIASAFGQALYPGYEIKYNSKRQSA